MAKQKQKKNRYNRNSTKRRLTIRPIRHPFRLLAIALGFVAVLVTAVIWGNILYQKSEAYRNDKAAGKWDVADVTPDAETIPPATDIPDVKGGPLSPGASLRPLRANGYTAATLWLCDAEQNLPYESEVAMEAGIACGEHSLKQEVSRLHENGLRAVGVFTVRALGNTDDTSSALTHYRMETELSILEEYAATGLDEILLLELPVSHADAQSYVSQLKQRIGQASPLIGVAFPFSAIVDLSEGETLPAEYLRICDYLTLDMTDVPAPSEETSTETETTASDEPVFTSELSRLLYRCRYPYVRYQLRLLFNYAQENELTEAVSHGFDRFLITASTEE